MRQRHSQPTPKGCLHPQRCTLGASHVSPYYCSSDQTYHFVVSARFHYHSHAPPLCVLNDNAIRPGWVETAQHGLVFGFDITKVMFSSGNVTERKRMGHIGGRPGEGGPSGRPSNDLEEVHLIDVLLALRVPKVACIQFVLRTSTRVSRVCLRP